MRIGVKAAAFTRLMLDTRCWMLVEDPVFSGDIQECSNSEVQKHPVSRNQYPESANTGNGVCCNGPGRTHNFMKLLG